MGKTLTTNGIEGVLVLTGREIRVLKVVGVVALLLGIQIQEHCLFFTLAIKQKLNIFIKISPFLWLRFFIIIIFLIITTTDIWLNIIFLLFIFGIIFGGQGASGLATVTERW